MSAVPRTAAQTRVMLAALDLFAVHGVCGTSLQMIADAMGMPKVAAYQQFKTEDEIAVEQRRMVGVMQSDPVVIRFLAEHKPFQDFLERLYAALIGEETGPETLIRLR